MVNNSITETYESLPKIAKIIIQLLCGAVVGGLYRIAKFLETKNNVTLIAGILNFVGLGFVFWVVDLVTEILYNKITILAD